MKILKYIAVFLALLFAKNIYGDNIIISTSGDKTICVGGDATFHIVVPEPANFQWQIKISETWTDVGENEDFFQFSNANIDDNETEIRCIVNGAEESDIMILYVVENPAWAATSFSDNNICQGGTVSFSASFNGGVGGSIVWRRDIVSEGEGEEVNSPNIENSTGTFYYRPHYNSTVSGCELSPGNEHTLVVAENPQTPTATKLPNTDNVCIGALLTLENIIDNGGGTGTCGFNYQYNDGTAWSDWITAIPSFEATEGENIIRIKKVCDGEGCDDSDYIEYSWTAHPQPTIPIITETPPNGIEICVGADVSGVITDGTGGVPTTTNNDYQYTVDGGNNWLTYVSNDNITSQTIGDETVQIRARRTSSGEGCVNSDYSIVKWDVVAQPSIISHASNENICSGGSFEFEIESQGGTPHLNYQWEFYNSGNWENVTNDSPSGSEYIGNESNNLNVNNLTQLGLHSFRCVVSASGWGCQDAISETVNVDVQPIPTWDDIYVSTNSICEEEYIEFEAQVLGGIDGNIIWIRALVSQESGESIVSPNIENTSGTFYYRPRYNSDYSGCILSDGTEYTINVKPRPTIINETLFQEICSGDNTEIVHLQSSLSNTSIYWYISSVSNGITGFQNNMMNPNSTIPIQNLNNNQYLSGVITITIETYANGCHGKDTSYSITVNPLPVITGLDKEVCVGDSVMLNLTGAENYSWYPEIGLSSPNISNPYASPSETISYSITGTDGNGCTSNANLNVFVNNLPDLILTAEDTVICKFNSTTLNASVSNGNPPYLYTWDNELGYGSNKTVNPLVNTSYNVTVTDNKGCENNSQINIEVKELPEIELNSTHDSQCIGGNVDLSVNLISGAEPISVIWNNNLGTGLIKSITVLESNSYSVTATDINGCTAVESTDIIANPNPIVEIIADSNQICIGDSIVLNLNIENGISPYSITWDNDLGSYTSIVDNPITNTTYSVHVSDSNNCTAQTNKLINVNPLPNLYVGAESNSICIGESVNLYAGGVGEFVWSPSNSLNFAYISNPIATPTVSTWYFASLTDSNACTKTDSIFIEVNPIPELDLGADISICYGDSVTLFYDGDYNIEWNSGNYSNPWIFTPENNLTIIGKVTDQNSCSNTDSLFIIVNSLPNITISENQKICLGDYTELFASGGISYTWNPSIGLDNPNIYNPTTSVDETTEYFVTVTDENDCSNIANVLVEVFSLPTPIITGDTQVCKNQSWVEYSVNNTNNQFEWVIDNGAIMSGQYTNNIWVHWNESGNSGIVSIIETDKNEPYCQSENNLSVDFSEFSAPAFLNIKAKSNNINTGILLVEESEYNTIQWGYEKKSDRIEIYKCSNIDWCNFEIIDTVNYYYWAKTAYNSECVTKSYFNKPPIIISVEQPINISGVSLFPNPTNSIINIIINNEIDGSYKIRLYNSTGSLIYSNTYNKTLNEVSYNIDLYSYPQGIYFISIIHKEKYYQTKIIKN
jgi:hypothetical protein